MAGIIGGVNHSNTILNQISNAAQKTSQILSSGSNLPRASYNSSAYSILQRMNAQTNATEQSIQNTQNASAMMKTAAGATANTVDALTSIQQYLVNAANGTNSDSDRAALQENINQLVQQIDDNARVEYNGMNLLDGSREGVMIAGVSGYENISLGNMSAEALGLIDEEGNVTIDVSNDASIQNSLEQVTGALQYVQGVNDNLQATLQGGDILNYSLDEATTQGAYLARLEYQADNYTTMEENTQAAASNIGDADMAKQVVKMTSQQIQQQVAIEMSKIFNHSQSSVLSMLR
ncbi:MAG: hypothetical protein IJT73_04840 [Selenomonadaceae bacterium]|nr:hypothetical protein [Selenomonadaceae bacterium]